MPTTTYYPVLPPVVVPTKLTAFTRAEAMALYPSSPLHIFPPPAPSVRRSLRDRCGVTLSLKIEHPLKATGGPWSPRGPVQPHCAQLPRIPRRRSHKPWFGHLRADTPVEAPKPATPPAEPTPEPEPEPTPEPTPEFEFEPFPTELPSALRPPQADAPHLQAIIPSVWVSFGGAERAADDDFTHVVEIAYPDTEQGEQEANQQATTARASDDRVQRLRIELPAAARTWQGRAALALTDGQLRAARDFLAECLPQELAAQPEQGAVRVLVSAPAARPTDVMSVVGCYLAFVAGRSVEEVLQCIDEEESVVSVWKGEVSGDEVERAEEIARA